jgi:hypothetical protein
MRVYLFPQSTVDIRVYPIPPPAVCGREGVFISTVNSGRFHHQEGVDVRDYSVPQSTVNVRVYPSPPPAGCGCEGVFISTVNSGR